MAPEIEAAVVAQVRALLRQPEVVVGTWRAVRAAEPGVTEQEVMLALERIDGRLGQYSFDTVTPIAAGTWEAAYGAAQSAIAAVEAVDTAIGEITAALREVGGELILTADHGNLEMMRDPATGALAPVARGRRSVVRDHRRPRPRHGR